MQYEIVGNPFPQSFANYGRYFLPEKTGQRLL